MHLSEKQFCFVMSAIMQKYKPRRYDYCLRLRCSILLIINRILRCSGILGWSWNTFCKEVNKPITSNIFFFNVDVMFGLHPTANRPGNTQLEQFAA